MIIIITYNGLQNTVCNHTKRGNLDLKRNQRAKKSKSSNNIKSSNIEKVVIFKPGLALVWRIREAAHTYYYLRPNVYKIAEIRSRE